MNLHKRCAACAAARANQKKNFHPRMGWLPRMLCTPLVLALALGAQPIWGQESDGINVAGGERAVRTVCNGLVNEPWVFSGALTEDCKLVVTTGTVLYLNRDLRPIFDSYAEVRRVGLMFYKDL